MKKDPFIRHAIDESLSGVTFDAKDMRRVLYAVRNGETQRAPRRAQRRTFRPDIAFAAALALILVIPLGLFALNTQGRRTTSIVAAPGLTSAQPQATLDPQADLILVSAAPAYSTAESEAIRAARACFEAQCDTDIFTFEEYAVSVTKGVSEYIVTMESIYGNGCRFTVAVSATDSSVLRYSTPRLATVPTYLDMDAPEVRAWYDKYGAFLFTWPQDAQAEFSRRYEGGALRTAKAGELTDDEAAEIAKKAAAEAFGLESGALSAAYPMLYAGEDNAAFYVVYCTEQSVTDTMPETCIIVTLQAADGAVTDVSAK